ncbi:unnamed protein product, partial [Ixodes persulcatus]
RRDPCECLAVSRGATAPANGGSSLFCRPLNATGTHWESCLCASLWAQSLSERETARGLPLWACAPHVVASGVCACGAGHGTPGPPPPGLPPDNDGLLDYCGRGCRTQFC